MSDLIDRDLGPRDVPVATLSCAVCGNPNGPRVQYGERHIISVDLNNTPEQGWTLTDYVPGGKFTVYCPRCPRQYVFAEPT